MTCRTPGVVFRARPTDSRARLDLGRGKRARSSFLLCVFERLGPRDSRRCERRGFFQYGAPDAFTSVSTNRAQVQLIRIQLRLPEYGWTTQKVFHLLNVMCLFARGALFFIFPDKWLVNIADPPTRPLFYYVAFLLPGQIYFTTYTLLILFWAEIYHQVSESSFLPSKRKTPCFPILSVTAASRLI